MEFKFSLQTWSQDVFAKLLTAIRDAIQKFDFDSNTQANGRWLAVPGDKIVHHNLGVQPSFVCAQLADDAEGSNACFTTWRALVRSTGTIEAGTRTHCRVLMNK